MLHRDSYHYQNMKLPISEYEILVTSPSLTLAIAVTWKDFEPNGTTVLFSCHFKADDFDRTGQIVRVKEYVIEFLHPFQTI